MLYDDHFKMGVDHARMGMARYKWSDPHLQEAYNKGYDWGRLNDIADSEIAARQSIPGFPGQGVVTCQQCGYSWRQSIPRKYCANCNAKVRY